MNRRTILALGASGLLGATPALAQRGPTLEGFATPEAGFAAFAEAVKSFSDGKLLAMLGNAVRPLIWSGDAIADREARESFASRYAAGAEIIRPAPNRAELLVGPDRWPLPFPLIERGGIWRFDAAAGAQALVDRRIGRNELNTIEVLRTILVAQAEYAATAGRSGAFQAYATRFFSSPGTKNGLYWPSEAGEPESPLGPLVAEASGGGYRRGEGSQPFHGYLYRILEGQGPAAPGGALSYLVRGRMIGGLGVLAWPAQWGSTGVASFLASHHGAVWQANLGPKTAARAASITLFDPGPGWTKLAG